MATYGSIVHRIFLDADLARSERDIDRTLQPLTDEGYVPVVVDPAKGTAERTLVWAGTEGWERVTAIPEDAHGDWFLTTDPDACGRARPQSCRTILVGSVPAGRPAVRRCDSVVRDVHASVFEILAADAMTVATTPTLDGPLAPVGGPARPERQ